MGLFSAIGSMFSAIGSAVSSICSAIGLGSIGTALTAAITALNPVVGLIIGALPLVGKIVGMLCPKELNTEEVESGRLAVMAEDCKETVKPENFDTYSEYIKAIRENCDTAQVDEKMKTLSPDEKTAHQLVSVGLAGMLVAEKIGAQDLDPAFLGKVNATGMDAEKTISLVRGLSDSAVATSDVSKYFEGNLGAADMVRVEAGLKSALEKTDPSLKTEDSKNAAINDMAAKIDAAVVKAEQ
jgi:hypothetical protein